MVDATEHDRPLLDVTSADRRRPGRVDYHDPYLIAFLRDQALIIDPADAAVPSVLPVDPGEDAAHGAVIGAIIGASMWVVVIFLARCFL